MIDRRRLIILLLLLSLTGSVNIVCQLREVSHSFTFAPVIPLELGAWQSVPAPAFVPAYQYLSREYRTDDSPPIQVTIAYDEKRQTEAAFHINTCYTGVGWKLTENLRLSSADKQIKLKGYRARQGSEELLIFFGLYTGTRILPDSIEQKFQEVKLRIRSGRVEKALLLITVPVIDDRGSSREWVQRFVNDFEHALCHALNDLAPTDPRLSRNSDTLHRPASSDLIFQSQR